jgi:hypothetical protein
VWDMYRTARFIKHVRVLTFRDVNIEELAHDDQDVPPVRRELTPTRGARPRTRRRLRGGGVGFNATRRYRDGKWNDIWLLVVAGVLMIGAILWALGVF